MAWREPDCPIDSLSEELQEISRRLDVLTRLMADERRRLLKPGAGKALTASSRKHIRWLEAEIERLEGEWLEALNQSPELLKTYLLSLGVPGVGHKTARVVVSELYANSRSRTVKECAAYAGVAPFERSSGTSLRKPSRTSPTGNKRLRTALYMGAVSNLRND
jgi:transposase